MSKRLARIVLPTGGDIPPAVHEWLRARLKLVFGGCTVTFGLGEAQGYETEHVAVYDVAVVPGKGDEGIDVLAEVAGFKAKQDTVFVVHTDGEVKFIKP